MVWLAPSHSEQTSAWRWPPRETNMPQPTGITLGANLGLALANGDTVHLMIARAQIPVGAATKEANAPTVFVALEGPALIELDGTSACRINLVAGEYSCFFPVGCGVHGHLFELFRHLPQHGRLGILRVVAANPFPRLRLGALEISHHILGLGFPLPMKICFLRICRTCFARSSRHPAALNSEIRASKRLAPSVPSFFCRSFPSDASFSSFLVL